MKLTKAYVEMREEEIRSDPKDSHKFTKYAATWLNKESWVDMERNIPKQEEAPTQAPKLNLAPEIEKFLTEKNEIEGRWKFENAHIKIEKDKVIIAHTSHFRVSRLSEYKEKLEKYFGKMVEFIVCAASSVFHSISEAADQAVHFLTEHTEEVAAAVTLIGTALWECP